MKLLFIGGTKFVGRNIVESAIELGHQVYILQRGKTNTGIFDDVVKYIGDRSDIEFLIPAHETFDMVIDSCGYHPDQVQKSASFLKGKVKKYIFISTGSVYEDFRIKGLNEESALQQSKEVISIETKVTNENYGLLKAKCELVLKSILSESEFLILRPCIIVGKYDDTNRFNLLLHKIKTSTKLIVPKNEEAYIQFIDVRAIADFILNSLNRHGTFNLVGPSQTIKLMDFINVAKSILNPDLQISLSETRELDFPMYVSDSACSGFFHFDGGKAFKDGLKQYSSEETIKSLTGLEGIHEHII